MWSYTCWMFYLLIREYHFKGFQNLLHLFKKASPHIPQTLCFYYLYSRLAGKTMVPEREKSKMPSSTFFFFPWFFSDCFSSLFSFRIQLLPCFASNLIKIINLRGKSRSYIVHPIKWSTISGIHINLMNLFQFITVDWVVSNNCLKYLDIPLYNICCPLVW